jgi:hypothetical protein
MKRFVAFAVAISMMATVGWVLIARSAPGPKVISIVAPAFTPGEYSEHNKNGSSVCPAFVMSDPGGEVRGDMDNAKGSFFHAVHIPQSMQVTNLRLIVNDNDGDEDVFAYLIRRKIENGTANTDGYRVMGRARTEGAVANKLRAFNDNSIKFGGRVNNRRFMYFVELIDCGVPEPYSVQVFYKKP